MTPSHTPPQVGKQNVWSTNEIGETPPSRDPRPAVDPRAVDVGLDLSRDTVNSTDRGLQAVRPQLSPNLSASNQPLSILQNIASIVELTTRMHIPLGRFSGVKS